MAIVTVGIPFHNGRGSLGDAIRSVFAQTCTDWELLLIDDGSTDGALEVASRVADSRVRVVSDGQRRHLPVRLNQIIDLARGEFIARLDADDMLHPERLERQLAVLRRDAQLDLVSTPLYALDLHGKVARVGAEFTLPRDVFRVLRKGLIAHATVTARRSWFARHRYDERYPRAEDRELFARTCRTLRAVQVAEPLYFLGCRKDRAQSLRDYVATARDNRSIFRDLGVSLVGPWAARALIVESLAKEGVFRFLTAVDRQDDLVDRRGRVATREERELAEAALRRIRETRVPGFDG
jgi:glycosyltransferase involved in cell wall biosynthesis